MPLFSNNFFLVEEKWRFIENQFEEEKSEQATISIPSGKDNATKWNLEHSTYTSNLVDGLFMDNFENATRPMGHFKYKVWLQR